MCAALHSPTRLLVKRPEVSATVPGRHDVHGGSARPGFRQLDGEVTCDEMPRPEFAQRRHLHLAKALPRDWTARMEATAGWRADETGRFARQGGNFAEPILRVRVRDRGHQGMGARG